MVLAIPVLLLIQHANSPKELAPSNELTKRLVEELKQAKGLSRVG